MKEMFYSNTSKREWLDHGIYNGYEYVIMSLGTHPTAYIGIPKDKVNINFRDSDFIDVHGGITYESYCILDENINEYGKGKRWIGWDYAHLYDYMCNNDYGQYRKKWTTAEILEEVKTVVNQLIEKYKEWGTPDDNQERLKRV